MTWKNTADRYGSVSIGLHWMTLALLIGVYACFNLTEFYAKGSPPQDALKGWHFMPGLMVLVLVALRLLNALVGGNPEVVPPLPRWQNRLAGATHIELKEVHETIGTAGYFLMGAHPGAALFHHLVNRDNTLVRMLPGAR